MSFCLRAIAAAKFLWYLCKFQFHPCYSEDSASRKVSLSTKMLLRYRWTKKHRRPSSEKFLWNSLVIKVFVRNSQIQEILNKPCTSRPRIFGVNLGVSIRKNSETYNLMTFRGCFGSQCIWIYALLRVRELNP